MNYRYFFLIVLFFSKFLYCQVSVNDRMQGVWSSSTNGYYEDKRFVFYAFFKDKQLIISYKPWDNELPSYFRRYYYGFLDFDPVEKERDIKYEDLCKNGLYMICVENGFRTKSNHIRFTDYRPWRTCFEEDILCIIGGNGNESRFYKVSHLPFKGNQLLYNQSVHDTVDYHRMYLDANISEIVLDSVKLIQKDEKKTAKILHKGDIIEIFSCSDSTAFAGYITNGDEFIEGWVQKNAVEKTQFTRKVAVPKTYIYSTPEEKTKMYLIKNDEIELVEKVGDFWKMKYTTGKGKVIEGYVKRIDCW